MPNGNATQTVSRGYGCGPTPALQSVTAPLPPGQAQPYEGSYPNSLVAEIIPFVERNDRVIADKNSRAIAGLSMGAGHTIAATNNNPGVFGYIGVFSGGGRIDNNFVHQLTALKESGVKYYWLARKGPIAAPMQRSNRRGESREPGSVLRAITEEARATRTWPTMEPWRSPKK